MGGEQLWTGESAGVMIDAPGTVDRDDAVWVTREGAGWTAWVHVADVARVVRLGSGVDIEALRRGYTRYLPERTIPMLPSAAEQAASLRAAEQDIPTFRVRLVVDTGGNLTTVDVDRGRLTWSRELSYQHAAEALREDGHPLAGMLRDAYDLARTLLARRRAAGAFALYDLLRGWATDDDGHLVSLAAAERNTGYLIVQELMIAANEAAARWAARRELPLLFRNHRAGTASRDELADQLAVAESLPGDAEADTRLETLRQHLTMVLRPAVYEPWIGGHFGLNLPAYTHVTSPLRRYPDLVNQRILLAAADGRSCPYQVPTLEETAAAVNLRLEGQRARRVAGARTAAREATRAQLATEEYRQLDDRSFGKLVRLAVAEDRFSPLLADEIIQRADEDRLLPRDAAAPLFGARDERWLPVRQRLLRWLTAVPAHALTLLSLYRQQEQAGDVRWEERPTGTAGQPAFTVQASLGSDSSPVRTAPSKRAARQQAALGFVASLAGLPDPSTDLHPSEPAPAPTRQRVIPPGHPPAMAVNELAQAGVLQQLTWEFAADGDQHEPVHTCTVRAWCTVVEQEHSVTATGPTKAAAKAAAAAALWEQLGLGAAPTG